MKDGYRQHTRIVSRLRARLVRYVVLILGAMIFSFPFYWLVTTSWKGEKELFRFPPDFLPELPELVAYSPYLSKTEFRPVPLPFSSDRRAGIEASVWSRASRILDTLPDVDRGVAKENDESLRNLFINGLWEVVLPALPDDLFSRPSSEIQAEVLKRVDAERCATVWRRLRRELLLGALTVRDDTGRNFAIQPAGPWKVAGQPAAEVTRDGERYALVRYAVRGQPIVIERRYAVPEGVSTPEQWSLRLRNDHSYHHLRFEIESPWGRFTSRRDHILDTDSWQEVNLREPWVRGQPLDLTLRAEPSQRSREVIVRLRLEPVGPVGALIGKWFRNYRVALRLFPFARFVWNSTYLVIMNVLGQMVSCALVAYAFARLRWPGRDLCFVLLLSTMMLPAQVTMVPVFLIVKSVGWYNTLKPLWVPSFFGSAFFIFLLRQFFLTIPRDLEEAAHIDGCGYLRTFWNVMVPLIIPALAAIAIFQFMNTWNDFLGPLIFLNDMDLAPLSLGLFMFRTSLFGEDWGMLMAVTTVMTLPVLIMFLSAQRFFIRGITLTGLKG